MPRILRSLIAARPMHGPGDEAVLHAGVDRWLDAAPALRGPDTSPAARLLGTPTTRAGHNDLTDPGRPADPTVATLEQIGWRSSTW